VIAPANTAPQTRVQPPRDATRVWDREVPPPRRQPPAPPVRPRRSRWPWVLLALLVLAAGAVAAVALTGVIGGGSGTPTTTAPAFVHVPNDLVGKVEVDATDELTSLGLKAVPRVRASSKDPGDVVAVSPPGGSRLKTGASVILYISKGVTVRTVPKITDMTLADATALLTQHGLTIGDQNSVNDLADAGTVIAQDPAAGSTAPLGSAVAVTVSKGPKDVLVPDLTGQDLATATQNLTDAKLKAGTIGHVSSSSQPAGSIVSNDPPGGTQAPEGSTVNILLSSGRPKVTMPEVYGQKAEDAAQAIQNAGLVPRSPSDFPTNDPALDDTVRKTSPQPGTVVQQGSKVIISVYRYAAPTTDTTSTDTTTTDTTTTPGATPQNP
jgi:beta-lactam-binding protein with PASTA domain